MINLIKKNFFKEAQLTKIKVVNLIQKMENEKLMSIVHNEYQKLEKLFNKVYSTKSNEWSLVFKYIDIVLYFINKLSEKEQLQIYKNIFILINKYCKSTQFKNDYNNSPQKYLRRVELIFLFYRSFDDFKNLNTNSIKIKYQEKKWLNVIEKFQIFRQNLLNMNLFEQQNNSFSKFDNKQWTNVLSIYTSSIVDIMNTYLDNFFKIENELTKTDLEKILNIKNIIQKNIKLNKNIRKNYKREHQLKLPLKSIFNHMQNNLILLQDFVCLVKIDVLLLKYLQLKKIEKSTIKNIVIDKKTLLKEIDEIIDLKFNLWYEEIAHINEKDYLQIKGITNKTKHNIGLYYEFFNYFKELINQTYNMYEQ